MFFDQMDKIPFGKEEKLTVRQGFGKGRISAFEKEGCLRKGIGRGDDVEDLFFPFR